ncbi:class I SAM-dependent methyltransferase [bacterium]|nr:class I SAM-dependent methyltransferase [bacterium]NCQ55343.1 class I SAM-dependent methyltransferase [Candidatus Parcubacteria bacterium]NCS67144.1 class I SAM-dependent methyltransferase [Candidatus Peregrinibacteria bacterium]NCS96770.1 class I SAM-dependent methyltransferase [bacterium]
MKKALRYALPVPVKKFLKTTVYTILDVKDTLTGKRDKSYPPRRLNFVGSADFKAVGDEFAGLFKDLGGLKPTDRVLDLGSGIGRMALPLTDYLKKGEYEGFDIDARGVEWCQKQITPTHPNFEFQYVDLYNKYYNPKASVKPSEFEFPYADNSFDFVFATSVFTHLLPDDAQHYLKEIERVLAPNGTAFLTWFILDEVRLQQMKTEYANADFAHRFEGSDFCFYSHPGNPEAEIAYTEKWLNQKLGLYEQHRGTWCGEAGVSYQDIVIWNPKK